jgi:hypothetical protein
MIKWQRGDELKAYAIIGKLKKNHSIATLNNTFELFLFF